MTNARHVFRRLQMATENAKPNSIGYKVSLMLMDAEQNAGETAGVVFDSDEYWTIALASIAYVDRFSAEKDVQKWFVSHGYEW